MVGELAAKHGGTTAKAERTKEYKFRAMPYSTAVYSLPIEVVCNRRGVAGGFSHRKTRVPSD